MKTIYIIDSFKSIDFDESKKPLVICDIDHTFLRSIFDYQYYYDKLNNENITTEQLNIMINELLELNINHGLVKHTDKEGFFAMLEKVNKLGGKLIFLTARSSVSHIKTMKDLITAGLPNPESYQIHYTNNCISKGEYIKQQNLLRGYDFFVFVDDNPQFLESAIRVNPDINCYLFAYRK